MCVYIGVYMCVQCIVFLHIYTCIFLVSALKPSLRAIWRPRFLCVPRECTTCWTARRSRPMRYNKVYGVYLCLLCCSKVYLIRDVCTCITLILTPTRIYRTIGSTISDTFRRAVGPSPVPPTAGLSVTAPPKASRQ